MTKKQIFCYAITTAYARKIISAEQLKQLLAIYEDKEPQLEFNL